MDRESALSFEDEEGRYSPRDNMVPSRTDTPGPIPTYQYSRVKIPTVIPPPLKQV